MKLIKSAVSLLLISLHVSHAHSVDYYLSDEYGHLLSVYKSESNSWMNVAEFEGEIRLFIETALIPAELVFGNDILSYAEKGNRYSYQLETDDTDTLLAHELFKDKNKKLLREALETARFDFTRLLIGNNENVVIL